MACFFLHPPDDKAAGQDQGAVAVDEAPSAGDIAARLAHGQLVKELTVGLGMAVPSEATPEPDAGKPTQAP